MASRWGMLRSRPSRACSTRSAISWSPVARSRAASLGDGLGVEVEASDAKSHLATDWVGRPSSNTPNLPELARDVEHQESAEDRPSADGGVEHDFSDHDSDERERRSVEPCCVSTLSPGIECGLADLVRALEPLDPVPPELHHPEGRR